MRVLVADDERNALSTLEELVRGHPDLELVAACSDGETAVEQTLLLGPELLILDVQMPGATGLEVVSVLPPENRPLVIFATAHDDHAVEAFALHAVDYLLKPFDDERFRVALDRALERRREEGPGPNEERLQGVLSEQGEDRLAIHRGGSLVLVPFEDIEWVESADQYVRIHLKDGREELMRASMGHLEKRLPSARFMRVHRSAIVATDQIHGLKSATSGTGQIRMRGGASVPVSRTRLALVRRSLK
ncbi:Transcriptional regulatory protein YehT [Planctomycetes bacterium Poly30]|uniref:Transcriptional regulatory protein YehT n=1 Tax=Saltatorellus ferox TaxID=2528018 RepID=A0A518EUH6_9BACT|nr:Transcriptional regulatory protein YehT [Planctomycetes bacterium Poly30]